MWSTPNGYVIGDSVAKIAAGGLFSNISLVLQIEGGACETGPQ
jgi:hypothetical protein